MLTYELAMRALCSLVEMGLLRLMDDQHHRSSSSSSAYVSSSESLIESSRLSLGVSLIAVREAFSCRNGPRTLQITEKLRMEALNPFSS